jgi:hypothetical protein
VWCLLYFNTSKTHAYDYEHWKKRNNDCCTTLDTILTIFFFKLTIGYIFLHIGPTHPMVNLKKIKNVWVVYKLYENCKRIISLEKKIEQNKQFFYKYKIKQNLSFNI